MAAATAGIAAIIAPIKPSPQASKQPGPLRARVAARRRATAAAAAPRRMTGTGAGITGIAAVVAVEQAAQPLQQARPGATGITTGDTTAAARAAAIGAREPSRCYKHKSSIHVGFSSGGNFGSKPQPQRPAALPSSKSLRPAPNPGARLPPQFAGEVYSRQALFNKFGRTADWSLTGLPGFRRAPDF